MRAFLAIIFMFSVVADFSSACDDTDYLSEACSQFSCDQDSGSDHPTNTGGEGEQHHCHCHVGHSHTLVFSSTTLGQEHIAVKFYPSYPEFLTNYVNNYLSKVIRPPIV